MVAQQATEFAPGPLFGNQLNAAVAGAAFRTGDVGLLHLVNIAPAAEPIKPGSATSARQRSGATQQGSAGGALG